MRRQQLVARWRAALGWLTLDGRLRVVQPWGLLVGPLILLLALVFPARWLLYIAYVYLLLGLAAYGWVRRLGPRVELRRRLSSAWAQVGDELREEWQLHNRSVLPLLWLEIDDRSALPGYSARRVASVSGRERVAWRTTARCERRGVYQLGPLTAQLADPLGWFGYRWSERDTQQVIVYPPVVRLPLLALPRGQRGGLAQADLLQLHATPSVGGLREYVPGDPLSRIHWPYVARLGRLVVKQFDQERAGALWIVLDLDQHAYAEAADAAASAVKADAAIYSQSSAAGERLDEYRPTSRLELAVALVASFAAQALAEGRAVGLLADDGRRRLVAPGKGTQQLWRLLHALVDVAPTGGQLSELLREEPAGAQGVVVVSAALELAWLPALVGQLGGRAGAALALLVATRAEQAQPSVARLASYGLPAYAFGLGAALPLVNPPRRQTSARISPLGRVILND